MANSYAGGKQSYRPAREQNRSKPSAIGMASGYFRRVGKTHYVGSVVANDANGHKVDDYWL